MRDATSSRSDWTRQVLPAVAWWGAPVVLAALAGALTHDGRVVGAIWTAVFLWMATGCVLNALRCHRLHCYISGPVFLVGAMLTALIGSGEIALGPRALGDAINGTLILALLSFAPEAFRGMYRRP